MHESVFMWSVKMLNDTHIEGRDVVDVGALNVNGSLREVVVSARPNTYTGVDIRPGPNVDHVLDACDLPLDHYDLAICTEMLEHAENWQAALTGIVQSLRPGGWLLLTTRGPGFSRHDHPGDYWRFTVPMMGNVLGRGFGMDLYDLRADPDHSGVFAFTRWGDNEPADELESYTAIPVSR